MSSPSRHAAMPRMAVLATGLLLAPCIGAQQAPTQPQPPAAQTQPQPSTPQQNVPPTQTDPAATAPASTPPPAPQMPPTPMPQSDPAQAEFERLDRDGDGRVTSAEHAADAKERFDALDADHNYNLSAQELDEARQGGASIAAQIAGGGQARPLDANDNGEVSLEESENRAEQAFEARDLDQDGAIEPEELRQADAAASGAPNPATRP